MPLLIGTLIHTWLGDVLEAEGIPVMREVNVTDWLPEGWTGTPDFMFFDPLYDAWVLADLKTQKGESYKFTRDNGAKDEHMWQVSAYWHALVEMGLPMLNGFGIIYLPKNDTTDKNERVEVTIAECEPLPRELVWGRMEERWAATKAYLDDLHTFAEWPFSDEPNAELEWWINLDTIAPVQDRVQKMWWSSKTDTWDVKLVPHWSADYCPFPNEICDCSEQGTTKIGHWKYKQVEGTNEAGHPHEPLFYESRKGYEDYEPEVEPTAKEIKKRVGNNL